MNLLNAKYTRRLAPAFWVGIAVAIACLLGGEWWRPSDPPLREIHWPTDAQWIRTNDELQTTGCFRQDFLLHEDVDHAWVCIAAEGGFELTINGNPVGAWTYWRPTRQFQNGLSAAGQRLTATDPAMALNFPREYQWTGHANERTPIYFDIRPFLNKGSNAICVETEGRKPKPAFILTGSIRLVDGTTVRINSNAAWSAEPVPVSYTQDEWVRPMIRLDDWRKAEIWRRGPRVGSGNVPEETFEKPFTGKWVGLTPLEDGRAGFEELVLRWDQDKDPQNALLRVASAAPYAILLNGQAVRPASRERGSLNNGGWLVNWEGRRPLSTMPTLLDPDETESAFAGHRFENPRHGDPTANHFKRYENTLNRTRERPSSTEQGEELDDQYGEKTTKGRLSDPLGYDEEASLVVPLEVSRTRNEEAFHAYGIGGLIQYGPNELRLRIVPSLDAGYSRSRLRRIAAELVTSPNDIYATGSNTWRVEGNITSSVAAAFNSLADIKKLPELLFVGNGWPARPWKALALVLGLLAGVGMWFLRDRVPGRLTEACAWFGLSGLCALGLRSSFFERSEFLWFRSPYWAAWVLLAAGSIALLAPHILRLSAKLRSHGSGKRWLALILLLGLCFVIRAWKIDAQPIDDDEFASIQGVASIVKTGVPEIGEGIWYTRSPLYHYVAAVIAWVAGTNLWTLRLFSVFTSIATAVVAWCLCRSCFRNRWIAVGAVLLFALHPYLIFTSHIARFYQQQQLLITFTALCLIRGFVQTGGPRWIVATIFSFGAAILSQEISIGFAPCLFLTYLLFGRDLPWRWELKAGLAGVIIGALFAIDILVFQMKCLTWTSGVSPNVEATIAPTFWELGNLATMFIGYSRLHLLASAFLPFSLTAALRKGNRSVLALHTLLYTAILFTNLLVTSTSFRYQYAYITLWIPLCVHGLYEASRLAAFTLRSAGAPRRTGPALAALAGVAVILSWSPWRILGSYDESLLGDSVTALRYVKGNLRPIDKVMITEPHPHAAKMELGKVDYDLALPILYDFAYWDDGILRDRNGDAQVINRLAQFQEIFATQERVWIIVNREKLRSRTRNLRWEYSGAREEYFLRRNCQLAFRSYLWNVYLWDRNEHRYHAFRSEPGQWTE
jgi:4-amino-4-deoxy-L-arabinose transferase-like glycosyltransferase